MENSPTSAHGSPLVNKIKLLQRKTVSGDSQPVGRDPLGGLNCPFTGVAYDKHPNNSTIAVYEVSMIIILWLG